MSIPPDILRNFAGFINKNFIQSFTGTPNDVKTPEDYRLYTKIMSLPAQKDWRLGTEILPHNPTKWFPLNILGEGSFGIASLWGYQDPEAEQYKGTKIVMKTGKGEQGIWNMIDEGKIMNELSKAQEEHLTNMIYAEKDFTRLYLEYCHGGDLTNALWDDWISKGLKMKEERVWRLFFCLCKGLWAMHEGLGGMMEVIHYDMKPDNVLIQPDPAQHRCLNSEPLYKIGDFGLAHITRPDSDQPSTLEHASTIGSRGTSAFWSPEMFAYANTEDNDIEEWQRRYGGFTPKLDVWAIGVMVWQFMVSKDLLPTNEYEQRMEGNDGEYWCNSTRYNDIPGQCYGARIKSSGYSEDLIALVQWCLMKYPGQRCSSSQLLPHLEEKIAWFNSNQAQVARDEETSGIVGREPKSIRLSQQPSQSNPESPLGHYAAQLERFLAQQGRTKEYYEELQRTMPEEERNRLIDAFQFQEMHTPEFYTYLANGGITDLFTVDKDFITTYQMAFEDTPLEILRCMKACKRRGDDLFTRATRMELVRRQRRYEGTQQYKDGLLSRFMERYKDNPYFMLEDDGMAKMRVQRAYEDSLPIPHREGGTKEEQEEWTQFRNEYEEWLEETGTLDEFKQRMRSQGMPEHMWSQEMVRLQKEYLREEEELRAYRKWLRHGFKI